MSDDECTPRDWTAHVDRLLRDGESACDRVELGSAIVVVTTQRLLVGTRAGDGADVRGVDRATVRRVTVETDANRRAAGRALGAGVLGAVLLVLGTLVDGAGVVAELETGAGPASGVVDGVLGALASLLGVFEATLLAAGVLILGAGAVFGLQYARSRSRTLCVRVAGDEHLTIPVTDAELEAGVVPALSEAIGSGSAERVDSATTTDAGECDAATAIEDGSDAADADR